MTFDRSDGLTFAIGLAAALAVTLGEALVRLEGDPVTDWGAWASGLGVGLLSALGRYLVSRAPEALARQRPPGL